ncbi:DegT/DnrJ/EryC1/StrS family aminotransferase [Pseudonocardia lutea]|uniref:DegT/DnrJ/EryC1/StrS family aminotransferase n=1 Tax=Pseudonocardia lutea TaxID=2172015 RepID=A0ABW1II69_9PSEU
MDERVPVLDLTLATDEVRDEVEAGWSSAIDDGQFVGGSAVGDFEREWAAYCGATEAVSVANGTDALTLTLRALGIGRGCEVILPANTFIATAAAVVLAGATPRFADVDPETLLLTADTVSRRITPRTRAVIVVHLYGQPADVDSISSLAIAAGLVVIEDAAQAHGARWRGSRVGSLGIAGCFSFYPGKTLGAFGDGGAVVTSNPALARELRALRNHGRPSGGSHHGHVVVGTNSRLDTLQAVVLSTKLRHLDKWIAARREIVHRYHTELEDAPIRPVTVAPGAWAAPHLAVVQVPDRRRAMAILDEEGIDTAVHYPVPCHLQPAYRRFADRALPTSEAAARHVLSLPLFPHMSSVQVDRVCAALKRIGREAVIGVGL